MIEPILITNTKGQNVGIITEDKLRQRIYQTRRDYKQGQVFYKLKELKVAIDVKIVKQLARERVQFIIFHILNLPTNPNTDLLYYKIHFQDFLTKSERINYDKSFGSTNTRYGEQRIIKLTDCTLFYYSQKEIQEYI